MVPSLRRPLVDVQNVEAQRHAKRLKRIANTAVINEATAEVLKIRAANGGKKKHGDIKTIVEKYKKSGCDYVTRSILYKTIIKKQKKNHQQIYVLIHKPKFPPLLLNLLLIQ
jgi:hypothetical protein